MKARGGMALAATLGVVSLVAILAVATLSLAGRLVQGSSLSMRDARLDGAPGLGLGLALSQWRNHSFGLLAVGATREVTTTSPGGPGVSVAVTRLSADVFWIAAEASAGDGSDRRENLVVRLRIPHPDELLAEDSTNVSGLGFISVDSLAATADLVLAPGTETGAPDGVVHAKGDLTLSGGTATGILIVDGRLTITGAIDYRGIIIVRGVISIVSPEVSVSGLIRVGGEPSIAGTIVYTQSGFAVQDVLWQYVRPAPVRGRAWADLQ